VASCRSPWWTGRWPSRTAYAVDWWLISLEDAAVGGLLIAIGPPTAVVESLVGIGHLVLVGRRALRRLRAAAGL
jgi:hypothetical protein